MSDPPRVIVVANPSAVDGYRMGALRGRCEYFPKPVIFEQLLVLLSERGDDCIDDYARAFSLSPQERAVLEHAISGEDDDVIGGRIGCARTTVKSYWIRIYTKVGERRRDLVIAHFARWLIQRRRRSGSRAPTTALEGTGRR
ncbi:MAG TPA: LuxR C-terminal-related transcriptional regulator [Polyangiaceae bacterium]|nr:LuxR C-terminal-related transcriptional regulator [Polyangiaceae bacterium]